MVRLSGHILPVYSEPDRIGFWQQADIQQRCQNAFRTVNEMARDLDVRLCFHSGQFCKLVGDNDDLVQRRVIQSKYHANLARWGGYGRQFQDPKIHSHVALATKQLVCYNNPY